MNESESKWMSFRTKTVDTAAGNVAPAIELPWTAYSASSPVWQITLLNGEPQTLSSDGHVLPSVEEVDCDKLGKPAQGLDGVSEEDVREIGRRRLVHHLERQVGVSALDGGEFT